MLGLSNLLIAFFITPPSMCSENETKMSQLITNVLSAWNAHDPETAAQYYTPDYLGRDVSQLQPHHGQDGLRRAMTRCFRAFPDIHFTQDSLIIQGNAIALAWTAQATHQGRLMNIPASGRSVRVQGVSLLTIANGKIKEASYIWDVAGLLRGIGLLPEL
ncbi:MAG: hypothetical protein FOGNACKC_01710 [Anaerolineae bacterium]|nr:hypothetical protein [Anaerolineae bacterium]